MIPTPGDTTLNEMNTVRTEESGLFAKIFSEIFSIFFHPVFIPLYVVGFLLYIHPTAFTGFSEASKRQVMVIITLNAVLFPLLSVLLLKALGFIQSIRMHVPKDRIIPLIAAGIFLFWTYTVFKEQSAFPSVLKIFFFGVFLASSLALIVNTYSKVSLHAIGMGGWMGIFLVVMNQQTMLMTWPLAVVILLTGLVCSARLIRNHHTPFEVVLGIAIGLLTQFISVWVH
jgi:nitrate reductase NapE component